MLPPRQFGARQRGNWSAAPLPRAATTRARKKRNPCLAFRALRQASAGDGVGQWNIIVPQSSLTERRQYARIRGDIRNGQLLQICSAAYRSTLRACPCRRPCAHTRPMAANNGTVGGGASPSAEYGRPHQPPPAE